MKTKTLRNLIAYTGLLFATTAAFGQGTVYTFTTAEAAGTTGPTQGMVDAAYAGTTLDGTVTVTGGIQYWTVPATGDYQIEAWGAQGYGDFGGRGAYISGEFSLTAGQTIKILVGQEAPPYLNFPATTYNHQFGGGGGSFVTTTTNSPYIVAGGGGGNHGTAYVPSCDGQITESGGSGANGSILGAGGTAGSGGDQASSADGGGGLLGDGAGLAGGQAFVNGGAGGFDEGFGGFGCGGGTSSWNNYRGGGGGGYSGGGGANNGGSCCPAGGGGGSFNGGTNQIMMSGVQLDDGLVVITQLAIPPNDAGIEDVQGITPPLCPGTYPLDVKIRNFGSNQITPVTVNWTVNGVAQTPFTYSSTLDTLNGAGPDTAWVNIGSVAYSQATEVKVWTTMPNNVADISNANDTFTVNLVSPVQVTAWVYTPITCTGDANGNIAATITGGSPGYTINWSNGGFGSLLQNLSAGTYTAYATDAGGCIDSMEVTISDPTPLSASATSTDISCFGGSDGTAMVSATGGYPTYEVVWSNGTASNTNTGLSAGYHAYTVTDSMGCTVMDSVEITAPDEIAISNTFVNESGAGAGDGSIDITVTGGTSPYSYAWSTGATTEDLSGVGAGVYTVTVTDNNGCTAMDTVAVGQVGIDETSISFDFSIYPNPTKGKFTVSFTALSAPVSIEIVDLLGKKVNAIQNVNADQTLEIDGNSGVYILKVMTENKTYTKRIVVQK